MGALKLNIKAFYKKKCQRTATYIHEQISNNKWAFEVFRRTLFLLPTSNMKVKMCQILKYSSYSINGNSVLSR